jgi:hypothetical protein
MNLVKEVLAGMTHTERQADRRGRLEEIDTELTNLHAEMAALRAKAFELMDERRTINDALREGSST